MTSSYDISDAGGIEILCLACAALDRAEMMAEEISNDGCTIMIKNTLREHPCLRAELANRAFVSRSLQRLGLNVEAIRPVGRPPTF